MNMLHILDCLRKDFREILIENNLNCTYPWIESMRGSLNYKEEEKLTCTASDDYKRANDISMNYATTASSFTQQKCLGTLQIKSYGLSFTPLEKLFKHTLYFLFFSSLSIG